MKIILRIMLLIAIAFIVYGYWGAFTASGNKMYDEMDAYYPFFMLLFGVLVLMVCLIMFFIRKRKFKK
jgi:heme/copper-type cytochrome/quinol oxidase subunit 2